MHTDQKQGLQPMGQSWFPQQPTLKQGFRSENFLWGVTTNSTSQGCGAGRLGRMEVMSILPVSPGTAEGLSAPVEPGPRARSEGGLRFSGRGACPPPASQLLGQTEPSPTAQTGRAAGRAGCGPISQGPPGALAPSASSFRGSPRAQPGCWDPQRCHKVHSRKPGRGHPVGVARGLRDFQKRSPPCWPALWGSLLRCRPPPPQTSSRQVRGCPSPP